MTTLSTIYKEKKTFAIYRANEQRKTHYFTFILILFFLKTAWSAGAVEYTKCISAEG